VRSWLIQHPVARTRGRNYITSFIIHPNIPAEGGTSINKAVPTFNSSSFVFNLGSLNIVFFGLDAMITVVSLTLIVTHIASGATFLVATFSMSARVQALQSLIPIGTRT
jgi:hypothetical protein